MEQDFQQQQLSDAIDRIVGMNATQFDLDQKVPASAIAELGAAGILGAQIPVQYGGGELDPMAFGNLCEQVGYASGSVLSLLTVHTIVASTITRWGMAAQKAYWLPRLATGETIGAFALSEPNVGSDAKNIDTVIRRGKDGFVVSGTKKWISCGQIADLFLVIGNCEGRIMGLLVDRNTPGLQIKPIHDMLGFRAAMLAEISMDACVVPADRQIGSIDFGYAQVVGSVLDHGRFCIAWGSVGLAQASLDACLSYTEQRKSFGVFLKEHQLIQQMIAEMATNTHAARLLCKDAARLKADGDNDMISATTMAKYFAARIAESVTTAAVQLHGANGCSSDYPVQRYFRDAKIMSIIEGSTEMQQILIAQHAYRR
jgi:alkylation response protein AidB-like acyl-CoA dehydrogenase